MVKINRSDFKSIMKRVRKDLQDPHSRFFSWDHSHAHWLKYVKGGTDDDHAALHLAFYLASWGMYRGSSALLQRDYRVLVPVVRFLRNQAQERDWADCMLTSDNPVAAAEAIRELSLGLNATLEPQLIEFGRPPSDTLLSKILLNTLVCVPAWDRNVKLALRALPGLTHRGSNGFNVKFLVEVTDLLRQNRDVLATGRDLLPKPKGFQYPLTKLLDLYLWYKGLDDGNGTAPNPTERNRRETVR